MKKLISSLIIALFAFSSTAYAISEYCSELIGSGKSAAYMTWTTDNFGNVLITLENALEGEDPSKTVFRYAMAINSFNVNGGSAATYFRVIYSGSVCTLELRDAAVRPDKGAKITFNGVIEYSTALELVAFPSVQCSYTYGSTCASLEAPTITGLTQEGILTFTTVTQAQTYVAKVLYNDAVIYEQTVVTGDKLKFRPYIMENTTYQVTVEARAGEQYSDPSVPVDWTLMGKTSNLPQSTVCESLIQGLIDPTKQSYLTFETDIETGDFIIRITADETQDDARTYFRGDNGMTPEAFLYDGQKMSLYFTRRDKSANTSKEIVYVPNTDGDYVPCIGHTITFNAAHAENTYYIEWSINGTEHSPFASSYSYEYVYGTTCAEPTMPLDTPTDLAVSTTGIVTFTGVEHAGAYEVEVSDEDYVLMTWVIENGGQIVCGETIVEGFVYYIRLRAIPSEDDMEYRASDWTEVVEWDLTDAPTGLKDMQHAQCRMQNGKAMKDGRMIIIKHGCAYSLLGNQIK